MMSESKPNDPEFIRAQKAVGILIEALGINDDSLRMIRRSWFSKFLATGGLVRAKPKQ